MKGLHYVATAKGLHAALETARAANELSTWLKCCECIAVSMQLDREALVRFLAICKTGDAR
jgi:hypothetical protein